MTQKLDGEEFSKPLYGDGATRAELAARTERMLKDIPKDDEDEDASKEADADDS